MPSLQVRTVPEHIYKRIVQLAALEKRSITQETLSLLESALGVDRSYKKHRKKLIDCILKENEKNNSDETMAPANLIRENREI